jgi:hypothetical protein
MVASVTGGPLQAAEKLDFNRDIRPILSDKCFKCHGFDDKAPRPDATRQADVAIRWKAAASPSCQAKQPTADRPHVVKTRRDDAAPDSGKKLSDATLPSSPGDSEGADTKDIGHLSPVRLLARRGNKLGPQSHRSVTLAQLEKNCLRRNGKTELLRRVTFDLTGLRRRPPRSTRSCSTIHRRVRESRRSSVDIAAFRRAQGSYWLDAAATTHGLHFDNEQHIWLYRDYVINAADANKPFDQFAVEQLPAICCGCNS